MVEMQAPDGSRIKAHPTKVSSLENKGWVVVSDNPAIELFESSEEE